MRMSIVPINEGGGRGSSNSSSLDLWDPMDRIFSDLGFPWGISSFMPELGFPFGSRVKSHVDWRESSRGYVWKVVLPGFTDEDVLVELQDHRMLQVSVESGNFMTRFRIPEDANLHNLKAQMNGGVLLVTVPKGEPRTPDLRVVEIEGTD